MWSGSKELRAGKRPTLCLNGLRVRRQHVIRSPEPAATDRSVSQALQARAHGAPYLCLYLCLYLLFLCTCVPLSVPLPVPRSVPRSARRDVGESVRQEAGALKPPLVEGAVSQQPQKRSDFEAPRPRRRTRIRAHTRLLLSARRGRRGAAEGHRARRPPPLAHLLGREARDDVRQGGALRRHRGHALRPHAMPRGAPGAQSACLQVDPPLEALPVLWLKPILLRQRGLDSFQSRVSQVGSPRPTRRVTPWQRPLLWREVHF